jgi:hypothetical protein
LGEISDILSGRIATRAQSAARYGRLRLSLSRPYIPQMNLDLTDEETVALTRELHSIIERDRYPFSQRIRTLKAILF